MNPPIYKYNIGDTIKDTRRNFTIKEQTYKTRIRNNGRLEKDRAYIYHCNNCGWDEGEILESKIIAGESCSCCAGKTVVPGINSVADTDPWIVDYFIGGYEEAIKYSRGYYTRMKFKCPICGDISSDTYISNILRDHGFSCKCKTGISYPEKMMCCFLDSLKIDYVKQLRNIHFEWTNTFKYDFYLPQYNIIIETHGIQHYIGYRGSKESLMKNKINDKKKRELALRNGIDKYIEIDCQKSTFNYIKDSIENNADLMGIINKNIDWNDIEMRLSDYNKFSYNDVVNLWNTSDWSKKDLCKKSNYSIEYINQVLKNAELKNLLIETVEERMRRHIHNAISKPILCVQTNQYFDCYNTLINNAVNLFGVTFAKPGITRILNGKIKKYKGYNFIHVSKEEFENAKIKTPELVYS